MNCHKMWPMSLVTIIGMLSVLPVQLYGFGLFAGMKSSNRLDIRAKRQVDNNNANPAPAKIVSMAIESRTSSRYTQVQIHSLLENTHDESREAIFLVQIPESAFISNFSMLINDTWLISEVLEKDEAQKIYDDAKDKGDTAGQVSSSNRQAPPRGMDNFEISVNVAAQSEVEFVLVYSELFERRLGFYKQRISVRPGQIVPQLSINAQLYEPQGFSFFKFTPPGESVELTSSRLPDVQLTASNVFKQIEYAPSENDQIAVENQVGLSGDFVIEYDIQRENVDAKGGTVIIDNGYFVHYFSPSDPNLQILDKNVVFVIDVSGSMSGRKIEQTREAMQTILQQLRPNDYFNILLFSSGVKQWKSSGPVPADASNIAAARGYVSEYLVPNGSTNIEAALTQGVHSLSQLETGLTGTRGRMIVFLTDGEPTVGETNKDEIRKIVRRWNAESNIPIFCLGFGDGISMDFLHQLSYENFGFARKIYDDSTADATVQLETFFQEIDSVLVVDVTVSYDNRAVLESSLTKLTFPQYFEGSELIVAGEISVSSPNSWSAQVSGAGKTGAINYEVPVSNLNYYDASLAPWSSGFAEKLRAYLKIRELIQKMEIVSDEVEKEALKQAAVRLALEYNFVTPVTSMVLTQSVNRGSNQEMDMMAGMPMGKSTTSSPSPYDEKGEMHEITDLRAPLQVQRVHTPSSAANIRIISRSESVPNAVTKKMRSTSTPAKTIIMRRNTAPAVTSQTLAHRFRQNWLAKFPMDTCSNGSVNLDDSLTSLNWLQNLNIMKMASTPASIPQTTYFTKDTKVNPNAVLNVSTTPTTGKYEQRYMHDTRIVSPPVSNYDRIDYKTNPSVKPPYSYATLICMAMQETNKQKITLSAIYNWITENFVYYRTAEPSWQNSIRHNLSLNKCFQKVPRRKDEPGKGGFWRINPDHVDSFENGVLKKRRIGREGYTTVNIPPLKKIKLEVEDDSYSFSQGTSGSKENTSNPFMNFNMVVSDDESDANIPGEINWPTILSQDISVDGKTIKMEDLLNDTDNLASPLMELSPPPSESNSDDLGLDELLSQTDFVRNVALDFTTNDPLDLTVSGTSLKAPDWWSDDLPSDSKELIEAAESATGNSLNNSGLHTPVSQSPAYESDSLSSWEHHDFSSAFDVDNLFNIDNLPDPVL